VFGERVCVYAVVKPGHHVPSLDDVRAAFAKAEVAAFKYPDRLEIVDELPTTKVGKLNKRALRQDIAERLKKKSTREEVAR